MYSLLAGGAVYALGASANGVSGFLLLPLVLGHLYPAEYGRVALCEMAVGLLTVGIGLGLYVRLMAEFPGLSPEGRREFVRRIVGLVILAGITVGSTFVLVASRWGGKWLPSLGMCHFAITGGLGAVEALVIVYATLFRIEARAWRYVLLMAIQSGVGLGASITLVAGVGMKDMGMLAGRLIGDVAALGSVVPLLREYRPVFHLRAALKTVKEAIPVVPATLASVWIATSPRLFLDHAAGVAEVGNYAVASKIAGVISLLLVQPFALAWYPIMFQMQSLPRARAMFGRILSGYIVLGSAVAIGLTLVVKGLPARTWSHNYLLQPRVLCLLAFANVAVGLTQAVNIGPYVTNRLGRQMPPYLAGAGAIVALCVAFVPRWQAAGAAASLLLTQLIVVGLLFLVSQSLYRITVDLRLLLSGLGVTASAYGVSWLAGHAPSKLLSDQPAVSFLGTIAIALGIAGGVALVRRNWFSEEYEG